MIEELTTENKLTLAHLYSISCLSNKERQGAIQDLISKGFTLGKLSALWNIPRSTIYYWANPEKKTDSYNHPEFVPETEVQTISTLHNNERYGHIKETIVIDKSVVGNNIKMTLLNFNKQILNVLLNKQKFKYIAKNDMGDIMKESEKIIWNMRKLKLQMKKIGGIKNGNKNKGK